MSQVLQNFDCVVMLTWSNWATEPRSNRYHYATRFGRHLPVYFVQPDQSLAGSSCERVDGHNITIVHATNQYGSDQYDIIRSVLERDGRRRPLVWVYNPQYLDVLRRLRSSFVIFHATEDYFCAESDIATTAPSILEHLDRALALADMLVAVSPAVAESYRRRSRFRGRTLVLPNGCDFAFWQAHNASEFEGGGETLPVVFYQGAINSRLNIALLVDLVDRRPHWSFVFCGRDDGSLLGWDLLKARPNVRFLGMISPDEIAAWARKSSVGIIPFRDDPLMHRSLPLKAYEYLACGLPVVSTQIDELSAHPELFAIRSDAGGFAEAIERLAPSRADAAAVERRLHAASLMSYDHRFQELLLAVEEEIDRRKTDAAGLNVLILYDDRSTHVGAIKEHLEAFTTFSRHNVFLMPATAGAGLSAAALPFDAFDAVVVHFSVRLSIEEHISPEVAVELSRYDGPKILFIQDEYDTTETAWRWIETLGIETIYTNVPLDQVELVYPRSRFGHVRFLPTLTGYVGETRTLERFARPMADRPLRIAYRGRRLPHHYGLLGQEKCRIGVEVRRLADQRGIPVDIEVDDSRRIYGDDWLRFLGSARATLGTESGSNVFDFDGRLADFAREHAQMPFETFYDRFLGERDGAVRMNQISPKIFEAIRLRTALVLFEGEYSKVVRPHEHYIPLAKDFSNIDDVFARLEDVAYLEALTDRAYRDVIGSGAYSYEAFVRQVDGHLNEVTLGASRGRIVSVPQFLTTRDGSVRPLGARAPATVLLNDMVIGQGIGRGDLLDARFRARRTEHDGNSAPQPALTRLRLMASSAGAHGRRMLRSVWRAMPDALRLRILRAARKAGVLR